MNTIDTKNLKPAKRYASALIDTPDTNKIKEDLITVKDAVFSNNDVQNFFKHPVIGINDKKEAVKEIFEGKIDTLVLNLLYVLLDNNRFEILPDIVNVFIKETEKKQNIVHAEVTSVIELSEEQKTALKNKLDEKLKKHTILDFNIDKNIIAGLIIKIEDNVIDLSLKSKFDKLKKA